MNIADISPQEIEAESFRRIEQEVGSHPFPPDVWTVVRRMIHTTADLDYMKNVRFHASAVREGVKALRSGRPVITDTRMLLAGISTGRLGRLGVEAYCFMDDPQVAEAARRQGITRSALCRMSNGCASTAPPSPGRSRAIPCVRPLGPPSPPACPPGDTACSRTDTR